MRPLLFIPILLMACNMAIAANPFWLRKDRKLFEAIVKLNRENPREAEAFFKKQDKDTAKTNLGFGWKIWKTGVGGGYSSVSACFYYYRDSLAGYSMTPYFSSGKPSLKKRYRQKYQGLFSFVNDEPQPYWYNREAVLQPVAGYRGRLAGPDIPEAISKYMSPESGMMYGYSGGDGLVLPNRRAFNAIREGLTSEQVLLILYAKNPASRLTAIEYYLEHPNEFAEREKIDQWVEANFAEMPRVETMYGCLYLTVAIQSLFPRYYMEKLYRLYE